ncbi:MAG: hypothetical protein GY751_10170 [Bacteroidetes bacterium]|nr:hypothetical protein [Bacteroidota bacterium]
MVKVEGTIEEIARLFSDASPSSQTRRKKSTTAKPQTPQKKTKRTRKPSKYNLFMKKELKRLKKAHPRTKQSQLMKKAARAWRKHK